MTILEDLKSGRLVVAPREADLADYDAGLLNDWGGGNVDWWQDYLRAEIGRANDFWRSQIASHNHAAGLVALVEGMETTKEFMKAAYESLAATADSNFSKWEAAEARALAAEAERDEALTQLGDETRDYDGGYEAGAGDMAAASDAALARALAAEAERDALREALAPFGSGAVVFYENEPDDCVLSLGRWKYQEDGRARFYADVQFTVADVRRARALTEKNNG